MTGDSKVDPRYRGRNIGIVAHVDAGKTTLTERFLYIANVIHKMGDVHTGDTVMDFMPQERERGITIQAACITFPWKDIIVMLSDTPGHVDFFGEVARSVRVIDGAIVVIDACKGVQPQTGHVYKASLQNGNSSIFFINKMDKVGANFDNACRTITQKLGCALLPIHCPVYENDIFVGFIDLIRDEFYKWFNDGVYDFHIIKVSEITDSVILEDFKNRKKIFLENIAGLSDAMFNKIFQEMQTPNIEETISCIRQAVLENRVSVVLCGTAFKYKGPIHVLQAVSDFFPSSIEASNLKRYKSRNLLTGNMEVFNADMEQFTGYVFKCVNDKFIGRTALIKIFSGVISKGDMIFNVTEGKKCKVTELICFAADKQEKLKSASQGMIVGISVSQSNLRPGYTLAAIGLNMEFEKYIRPESVVEVAIFPETKNDQINLRSKLEELEYEDPSLIVTFDNETKQTIIGGPGELFVDVVKNRLIEKGVNIRVDNPKVKYRETITGTIKERFMLRKQTGGAGMFAEVEIIFEASDKEFEFEDKICGGVIPKEYIEPVKDGIKKALVSGPISGSQVIGIKAILIDGSAHKVDSNSLAFTMAGDECTKKALQILKQENRVLRLSPLMKCTVETPEEFFGNIKSEISKKGVIKESENIGFTEKRLVFEAFLEQTFGMANTLRSRSQGQAILLTEFIGFRPDGFVKI